MDSLQPPVILGEQTLNLPQGRFSSRTFRGPEGAIGVALWMGDLSGSEPVLCRVHSSCFTSEGLGGLDCDCVAQLVSALTFISERGRGVVFYLLQEGRGAGLLTKARDRMLVQSSAGRVDTFGAYVQFGLHPDPRRYHLVPAICSSLGLTAPLAVMTNNPTKLEALTASGLSVAAVEHAFTASPYNSQYLAAKAKSGHVLALPSALIAEPPRGLDLADPNVDRLGPFRRVASYDLPVALNGAVAWFRATAYRDEESQHERIVLSFRREPSATEIRHVFREQLFDRLAGGGAPAARFRLALASAVERGAGSVLAIPADPTWLAARAAPPEASDLELLHSHANALGARAFDEVA